MSFHSGVLPTSTRRFGCVGTVRSNFACSTGKVFVGVGMHIPGQLLSISIDSLQFIEPSQGTLINCSSSSDQLVEAKATLIQAHGRSILRALLCGFAGVAPRSVVPNLIELLSTLMNRAPTECRAWMMETLFAVCPPSILFREFMVIIVFFARMTLCRQKPDQMQKRSSPELY
jgi:hypothetical protein